MPPNNLAVYLSNRCSMSCRYCYVAVNQGEPRFLCPGQIRDGIDSFLARPSAAERKVSFLGGEPLLRWDILSESIRYARSTGGPGILLQVFTNGLELTEERLRFLLAHGVEVTVSLDGGRAANDANRSLHGREGSAYDAVMERLRGLPKERLGVNLVFTSRSVGELLSNIELFHREGYGRVSFTPDVNEPWTEGRIEVLRKTMEGFARYYSLIIRRAAKPFAIANLYAILEKARQAPGTYWWQDCHNLVLGADGHYYSCDKSLGFTFDRIEDQRVGSTGSGVDWARREGYYKEAREFIRSAARDANSFTSCPMGVYFIQKTLGQDPAGPLRGFEAVSAAYGDALLRLARELWDVPVFRELHSIAPGTPAP